MTQRDLFESDLFAKKIINHPPKPPSPAQQLLKTWRRLYEQHTGRALILPSQPAWSEALGQCKRLVKMIEDDEIREIFLSTYLHSADRYERERDYPLRLAMRNERFQKLVYDAQRTIAERRRVIVPTPTTPTRLTIPPTSSTPLWSAELLTRDGAVAAVRRIAALTQQAAERLALLLLRDEATRNRDLVDVRVSRG